MWRNAVGFLGCALDAQEVIGEMDPNCNDAAGCFGSAATQTSPDEASP